MERLRHESNHAFQRAQQRGISEAERRRVLQQPDVIEQDKDRRLHKSTTLRDKVEIVAVLAVGFGTAVLSKNPIAGLGAGTFVTIVTYYLKGKK